MKSVSTVRTAKSLILIERTTLTSLILDFEIEASPWQAAGRLHRNDKKSIFGSLAYPAASDGVSASYRGSIQTGELMYLLGTGIMLDHYTSCGLPLASMVKSKQHVCSVWNRSDENLAGHSIHLLYDHLSNYRRSKSSSINRTRASTSTSREKTFLSTK